jgi:hypothetical protein
MIVGAYCCSHGALMMTRENEPPVDQKDAIYGAFRQIGAEIAAARADAVVVIGTDHGRIYGWDLIPPFVLGVGDRAAGIGDAGTPAVERAIHGDVARAVLDGCMGNGIDMPFSEVIRLDHSFVAPMLLMGLDPSLPIVPLMQNCNVPPIPTLERSMAIGRVLGEVLDRLPERVVVVGTGGLSHWVGDADRRAFLRRPAGTRWADADKFPMVLDDTGPINATFDVDFMAALADGGIERFVEEWNTERIEEEAGNGAQEIRNWLMVAAAVPHLRGRTVAYEPVDEWLTGSALVSFA